MSDKMNNQNRIQNQTSERMNDTSQPVYTKTPTTPADTETVIPNTLQENTTTEKKTFGPLIGIIIIVVVLVIGGLYFWGSQLNKQVVNEDGSIKTPQIVE